MGRKRYKLRSAYLNLPRYMRCQHPRDVPKACGFSRAHRSRCGFCQFFVSDSGSRDEYHNYPPDVKEAVELKRQMPVVAELKDPVVRKEYYREYRKAHKIKIALHAKHFEDRHKKRRQDYFRLYKQISRLEIKLPVLKGKKARDCQKRLNELNAQLDGQRTRNYKRSNSVEGLPILEKLTKMAQEVKIHTDTIFNEIRDRHAKSGAKMGERKNPR